MKLNSQMRGASIENLTADPSTGTRGRLWMRTDTSPVIFKVDDGAAVRTFVTTDNVQTLTNKSLSDSTTYLIDNSDATKIAQFQVSGISTGTTRTFTFPDANTTLVGHDTTQTLTNKTLTTPTISVSSGAYRTLHCDSSNNITSIANGTSGTFLKSNGVGVLSSWDSVAQTFAIVSKTANYTVLTSDNLVLCDDTAASFTLTLYAASGNSGKQVLVKKTVATVNTITIDGNASETIDGATTTTVNTQYEQVTLVCDGSNWHILDRKCTQEWNSSLTFTPFADAFGTISNSSFFSRRVGDSLEVRFHFQAGISVGSPAYITLPTGYTIDSAKVNATETGLFGVFYNTTASAGNFLSNGKGGVAYYSSGSTSRVYLTPNSDNDASAVTMQAANGDNILNTGGQISGWFVIPISGWKA